MGYHEGMQKKIFVWFALIVVLPSAIIYFVINHLLINYVIEQQIANNRQLIQEMRKNLDTKLQHYQQLTMQFYLNDRAMEELSSNDPLLDCTGIRSQLDGFVNSNRLIASAYLITDRGMVSSGTGIQEIERVNEDIQPVLKSLEGRIHWTTTYPVVTTFGLEDMFFFGARHIRREQKPIATLLLGFNSQFFEDLFQYTPFEENLRITITNESGAHIASNHRESNGTHMLNGKHIVEMDRDDSRYIALASSSNASDWEITIVLDTREISREITYIRDMFNLSTILYILFFIIISLLVSKRLTKPIQALTCAVNKVGEGIMDVQVDTNHIDEIKQLSIGFNAMTDRIQRLLVAVKKEEENKQRAHLQALQLQLTPHLLYNSLNTIRWMAQINGQENIKQITLALSQYLRSLSDLDSEYITLRKELDLVEDYAVIQRFRYTDFTIEKEVPEELLDLPIHKLMIVNLVENSIIHGIADSTDPGIITIRAHRTPEWLLITVSDNGVGIPEEQLLALKEDSEGSEEGKRAGRHTGLRNIQNRLRLHHGPQCSLILTSDNGMGCSVTIPIPIEQKPV